MTAARVTRREQQALGGRLRREPAAGRDGNLHRRGTRGGGGRGGGGGGGDGGGSGEGGRTGPRADHAHKLYTLTDREDGVNTIHGTRR